MDVMWRQSRRRSGETGRSYGAGVPSPITDVLRLLGNPGAVANLERVRREQRRQHALVTTLLAAVDRADARRLVHSELTVQPTTASSAA